MKIPNMRRWISLMGISLARIVSEDSQPSLAGLKRCLKSSKDS